MNHIRTYCPLLLASLLAWPGLSRGHDNEAGPLSLPEDWHGFFLGAGPGYANVYSWEDDDGDNNYSFDTDYGDGDLGYIVSAGYRFNPLLAAEIAYSDSGTLEWNDSNVFIDDPGDIFDVDAEIDVTSIQLTGLGILPFGRTWEFYLRAGVAIWDADSNKTLTPLLGGQTIREQTEDDGVDFIIGIGAGRIFRDRWCLRLDYSTYGIDDDLMELQSADGNTDMWSLQLLYRFGVNPEGIAGGDRLEYPGDR